MVPTTTNIVSSLEQSCKRNTGSTLAVIFIPIFKEDDIMWSEQLKNGKTKFIERYVDPMTMKQHRVSVTFDKNTASTRKLALTALNAKIEKNLSTVGNSSKREELRLYELVRLYRVHQKITVKENTYLRNYHACNIMMKILGEDVLVKNLTAGYVNEKLAQQEEKAGTTNERITRFKALIRWGYNNDYVSDISWLDKIQPLKDNERKERLEEKYLESDELKILLESMTVTKWRYLAQFTALSGLRIGEAIALLDSDVDCENRIIRVTKSHDPNTNITGYPKTSTSYRDVYMQDELYTLCRHIRIAMKQEQLACGYRTDLFLSDVNGNYLAYYAYNKYLKELAHRVLDKKIKITTHVMRHTHVALLAEQGVSLDAISRRLGHSDSQITRDIYFHVTKKMQERENLQLKKIKIL